MGWASFGKRRDHEVRRGRERSVAIREMFVAVRRPHAIHVSRAGKKEGGNAPQFMRCSNKSDFCKLLGNDVFNRQVVLRIAVELHGLRPPSVAPYRCVRRCLYPSVSPCAECLSSDLHWGQIRCCFARHRKPSQPNRCRRHSKRPQRSQWPPSPGGNSRPHSAQLKFVSTRVNADQHDLVTPNLWFI